MMISGLYTSGATVAAERPKNLQAMNEVHRRGQVPIIGVNMALPMIEAAGASSFDKIMMPVSLALADRCDAYLRIGRPSKGANDEMLRFQNFGKPVYRIIKEVPVGKRSRTEINR